MYATLPWTITIQSRKHLRDNFNLKSYRSTELDYNHLDASSKLGEVNLCLQNAPKSASPDGAVRLRLVAGCAWLVVRLLPRKDPRNESLLC